MRDQFERNINYMRVSVTDRCNLRCVYCMPKDGVQQISHDEKSALRVLHAKRWRSADFSR